MTGLRQLHVTPDHVTERLDHFLAASLPELTRSQVKRLIGDGSVTLDGRGVKAGQRLRGGEKIHVTLAEPVASTAVAEAISLAILYEDSSLIVINKPAHMVVHPAPGHQSGTLVNALLHHCQDLSGVGGELRPGIVHRLDKGTSGVMVATKDDQTHNCLAQQFKAHTIQRCYRALVHGIVPEQKGTIDKPIGRHPVQRKKMSSKTRAGRHAVTHWRVLRRYEQEKLTLLDLALETGRTHQLRVHLSEMGWSVVGDPLYSSPRKAHAIRDNQIRPLIEQLDRQFLHAWKLGFVHPDGREMLYRSDLPEELQTIVDALETKYAMNPADLDVPNLHNRI